MARKKFSCDFETTTKEDDCRVWAYGWMEIGKKSNFKIGNSMDEFMRWVEKCQADLFFHNLKFDGSFIVNWLLKNGFTHEKNGKEKTFYTLISNMGQWYMIDICYGYKGKRKIHTVIYDSLKKLPFTVKKIGKDFGLEVLKIEHEEEFYTRERPIGHIITNEEFAYIKNDIEVIASALEIQFKQGMDRMTTGSDSLNGFKSVISKKKFEKLFPVFDTEFDINHIRKAYRGGFTWVNPRFQGKEMGPGMVFDVNSLYPSQMYDRELPYGMPIPFEGKYVYDPDYPLYMMLVRCDFELKDGYIPTIQLKKSGIFKDTEYLSSSNWEHPEFHVTSVDWQLIGEHYNLYNIEYVCGWKFRSKTGVFKEFIDKWMYIKTHSSGAVKQLAKLMLNSLYGKFATNPNVTGKIPYLKENGALGFEFSEEEYKDPIYTPMGAFITAWARYTTITTAQAVYDRIIYCDTDSIHITGTDLPDAIRDLIHEDQLGYWKHESTFEKAKFIRQKTYYEVIYAKKVKNGDGEVKTVECEPHESDGARIHNVKCAGMPENLKKMVTWDNFKVGLVLDGKKMPKQVDGGVILVDKEFTLKGVEEEKEVDVQLVMENMFKDELKMDVIRDLVEEHGFIEVQTEWDRYYREYKRIPRSAIRKYFRKSGLPIDVWCDVVGWSVDELLERLGAY